MIKRILCSALAFILAMQLVFVVYAENTTEYEAEEIILEAENADRKEGNMTIGATGNVKYVSFNKGRALEFDITLPYSGLYQFNVSSALSVTFYEKQTLNITIGGQTAEGTTYPTASFSDWELFTLCGIYLEAGEHTLRIEATYGGTHIDNFIIKYLGEDSSYSELKDVTTTIFYSNIKAEGTVLSESGKAVEGRTVEMYVKAPDGTISDTAVRHTTSSSDGKFELSYTLPKNSAFGIYEISLYCEYAQAPYTSTVNYTQGNTATIEAESYLDASGATQVVYNSITYITVSENGYLAYDINIPEDGRYTINLRSSGQTEASVNMSLDSIPLIQANVRKTGSARSFDDNIIICDFKKGTYKLKINATIGVLNLDYFSIDMLYNATDDVCASFVADINAAENAQDIYNTLLQYKDNFNIDLSGYTSNVFYQEPIFDELASHSYRDVQDIMEKLNSVAKQYKKTPDVSIYKGNMFLSELESGDLTMLVRTQRLTEPVLVIGAIYKDSRLYKMNYKAYTTQTSISIPLSGVEIDDSCTYSFKAFYVDDFNSVTPYDAYPSVYRELYVSTKGSDDNPGTKELPLKTLNGVKAILTSITPKMMGDIIVNIESGEYFLPETQVFNDSCDGKNGYNVIIRGEDSQNPPVLHGGRKISGWQLYKDGIYSAPLEGVQDVRNLYVDGFAATRARTENIFTLESFADKNGDGANDAICVKTKRISHTFARPQDLEAVWELNWASHRMPINGIYVKDDKTYFETSEEFLNLATGTDSIEIKKGRSFFLENAMELLDSPGEFYYNAGEERIYYYPHEGESLDNTYIPTTEFLFSVGDVTGNVTDNIIFSTLDIRYGDWSEPTEKGIKHIQADEYIYSDGNGGMLSGQIPAQFTVNNAKGIQIKDCYFSCLGSDAIAMKDKVYDSILEGNTIKDVAGSAISIGSWEHTPDAETDLMSKNITVENNLIRRTGQFYTGTVAISVYYANSVKICHNDIADIPYSGITLGWGWGYNAYTMGNFSVCHNKMADVMNTLIDGSHIYTLGPMKDSAVFENYTEDSKYILSGIYTDSGSSLLKIFKNVFYEEDKDSTWWYQGHNNTKNLHAFSNYTTLTKVGEHGDNNIYEDTINITEENYPQEALEIKENAGLSQEYKHLLEDGELPSYKESIVKKSPKDIYVNGYYRAAYKYDSSYDPTTTNVTVGTDYASFNSGEWMEYVINAAEEGAYNMVLFASQGWANGATADITVHLNGSQVLKGTVPNNGTWSVYEEYDFGKINLVKGENKIRIYNTKGGFHLNSFMLER